MGIGLRATPAMSEATPSRRDFLQHASTQKRGLAVVARIRPRAGETIEDAIRWARACDDAEVAALAVVTGADGFSAADASAIAAATTAPVVHETPVRAPDQVYAARLLGADAVVVSVPELDADAVDEIVAVARSLHMAAILAVAGGADLEPALRVPHVALGVCCTARDGTLDPAAAARLARDVPRSRTLVCIPLPRSLDDAVTLRGLVDAIVLDEPLRAAADPAELVRALDSP